MHPQRQPEPPADGLPFPAKMALGGLAVFGGLLLLQWAIFSALRFLRFGLFVVIVVGLFGWAVSAKSNR